MQSQIKFLNIVIYIQNEEYEKMYQALSGLYNKQENVETIFVTYDNLINKKFIRKNDIIYINGKESLVPGLLRKTIDALLLVNDLNRFDYIIRSNMSTVIDFDRLSDIILKNENIPINYMGGHVHTLTWLDPDSGIIDNSNFGLRFASGTMIIFSPMVATLMLEKRHYFEFGIVDDVAIGAFIKLNFPELIIHEISKHLFAWNISEDTLETKFKLINDYFKNIRPIAWRNKSSDRNTDAVCIEYICNLIKNQKTESVGNRPLEP